MVEQNVERKSEWPSKSKAFKLYSVIGAGSFGLVWSAKCKDERYPDAYDKKCAIKIIDLERFSDTAINEIRKEVSIMSICKHKNIVNEYISFLD